MTSTPKPAKEMTVWQAWRAHVDKSRLSPERIKRIDSAYPTYSVTITPTSANIDGSSSSITLNVQYSSITLVCDGTNWNII